MLCGMVTIWRSRPSLIWCRGFGSSWTAGIRSKGPTTPDAFKIVLDILDPNGYTYRA